MSRTPDLSVVVPMFNEKESVGPLCAALRDALRPLGVVYEVILVDDGSRDGTFDAAKSEAADDRALRVARLRSNRGQTAALSAGIELSRGAVIVTLDADLQNDPADIPALVAKLAEGFDVVCGRREGRKDPFLTRRLPSLVANRLISMASGVRVRDNGCTLKAFKGDLIRSVPLYSEMHRFIPAMTGPHRIRLAEIPVRHHARRFGASKYGLSRIGKVALDLLALRLIVTSALHPFRWFLRAAALPAAACVLLATWSVRAAAAGDAVLVPVGASVLMASLALFLAACGALCEFVSDHGDVDPVAPAMLATLSPKDPTEAR